MSLDSNAGDQDRGRDPSRTGERFAGVTRKLLLYWIQMGYNGNIPTKVYLWQNTP